MSDWTRIPASRIQEIIGRSGDAATVAWAHEGTGRLADLSDPMLGIAAAVALGNASALSSVTAPKDLKKAAAAALHRLRASGVRVESQRAPSAFRLSTAEEAPPSRAFVGLPDQDGHVEFLLTASDTDSSCVLAFLAGGPRATAEVRHGHVSRSELRDTWKQVEKYRLVEIPFATGLHYADRLLGSVSERNYLHFLDHVSAETLQSARILDPLANVPAANAAEPEAEVLEWILPTDMWDPALTENAMGVLFNSMQAAEARDAFYEAVVRMVCTQMINDQNRAMIYNHIELVAAAFRLRGFVGAAERALGYRRALEEGTDPGTLPPLLNSVKVAIANEAMGRMSQAEMENPE